MFQGDRAVTFKEAAILIRWFKREHPGVGYHFSLKPIKRGRSKVCWLCGNRSSNTKLVDFGGKPK